MLASQDGLMWEGSLDIGGVQNGTHTLRAVADAENGEEYSSSICFRVGPMPERVFAEVDHENAIKQWSERGLL